MSEVSSLPGRCSVCDERSPIAADVEAEVQFRAIAGTWFKFELRLCQECTDGLGLKESAARAAMAEAPSNEALNDAQGAPPCSGCGKLAQFLTSQGYRCTACTK